LKWPRPFPPASHISIQKWAPWKKPASPIFFLFHGDARDPYAALAHARPQDVTLTMVGGVPYYGSGRKSGSAGRG